MIMKTGPISTRIAMTCAMKKTVPIWAWRKSVESETRKWQKFPDGGIATAEEIPGLGKGNLILLCKGSQGNYFGLVSQQTNNNLSFRVGTFENNIDHCGKETWAMVRLPICNKNSAVNILLSFLFIFLTVTIVCLTKLFLFNTTFIFSLTLAHVS